MRSRLEIRVWKAQELPSNWFRRKATDEKDSAAVESSVKEIIGAVQKRGNAALIEFTEKFDKTKLTARDLRVTSAEIKTAYKAVSQPQVDALKQMREKLFSNEKLALKQIGYKTLREGITLQTVMRPIESVGCYVPAGQAVYPSTLIMTATPAKVAGVPRVVVCSPPTSRGNVNPLILVAADICEVNEVYKVGGVQAIAAMAYGTESIRPVKKIVGPGSKYVTAAKVQVRGEQSGTDRHGGRDGRSDLTAACSLVVQAKSHRAVVADRFTLPPELSLVGERAAQRTGRPIDALMVCSPGIG